jgi:ABC-type uncharacterized transport system permease subunit
MSTTLIILFSAALYLLAGVLAARNPDSSSHGLSASRIALLAALMLNAYAIRQAYTSNELDFGVSSGLYWITAIVALVYFLSTLILPIRRVGKFLLPTCGACLLIGLIIAPGLVTSIPVEYHSNAAFTSHILVSVFAYAVFALASFQALLLTKQETKLIHADKASILDKLPPLQTMETILFRLIIVGFVLLTATLVSGAIFSQSIFGRPFSFTHHIVLASMAWLVFAILLWGRYQRGWRGRQAARWTLAGFSLLVLGYFGTKIAQVLIG